MSKPGQLHCSPELWEHPLGLSVEGVDCSASLSTVWECCAAFHRALSLLPALCKQFSKKENQHRLWVAAGFHRTHFLAVTLWEPSLFSHFMFHKKQQLSLFDLAEQSTVRPLGVNLDLAKGHGTAQQLNSNSVSRLQ